MIRYVDIFMYISIDCTLGSSISRADFSFDCYYGGAFFCVMETDYFYALL